MAKEIVLPSTAEQTRRVLKVARERGVDVVLALHDAGLLWSPERQQALWADFLHKAAAALDETTVDQLADGTRVPATALDTKRLIAGWLYELGDAARRQ